MFVRVKKVGACEYLYLVENAREGGHHVQRVVKPLGRKDEIAASGMLDGLIASAARHSRRSIVLSSFYRGELPELRHVSIGPDLVFGRLWAETNLIRKAPGKDSLRLAKDRRLGRRLPRKPHRRMNPSPDSPEGLTLERVAGRLFPKDGGDHIPNSDHQLSG